MKINKTWIAVWISLAISATGYLYLLFTYNNFPLALLAYIPYLMTLCYVSGRELGRTYGMLDAIKMIQKRERDRITNINNYCPTGPIDTKDLKTVEV